MPVHNTYTYSEPELQGALNDVKDAVILRMNEDHNLTLDPAEYMIVVQSRGCLGRLWDKVRGAPPAGSSSYSLVRLVKTPTQHGTQP